ncbi:hypothetical protein QBC35DRAFT_255401 [Podospora australis]|uniref:Uncharacterized protein n=1 Tax=Podospora australis TaxID=1536484 RepID=A0AAN7AGV0_9PEZI|nr:hypothetical protein QBC35DRAFT_255401 [Podospora australis]
MDGLSQDTFRQDSEHEDREVDDDDFERKYPRGSEKRCKECRYAPKVCAECRFWLENYGCPRPEILDNRNAARDSNRDDMTQQQQSPSLRPYTSSRGDAPTSTIIEPYISSTLQTPSTSQHLSSSAHGFWDFGNSWHEESWTTTHRQMQRQGQQQGNWVWTEHFVTEDTRSSTTWFTKEITTGRGAGGQYSRQQQHITTMHQQRVLSVQSTFRQNSHIRRPAGRVKPNHVSPFSRGYTHAVYDRAYKFSTTHVLGLWAPPLILKRELEDSWRWRNYKRVILQCKGLTGLAEISARGWRGGNVTSGEILVRILFAEWPRALLGTIWNSSVGTTETEI